MRKDARIFVAGHRGMVGSALVRRLREGGYENLLLRTSLNDTVGVASIDFSSVITVADKNGDSLNPLLAGDSTV